MRKVFDNVLCQASLVPAVRTADANGTGVDTKGFRDGMAVISVGDLDLASGNETYAFNIEESDDNSTFAAVSGLTVSATADDQVKEIRLADLNVTRKRYLRVVLDVGGTTPSCPCTALIVCGLGASNAVGNA
jgi:hypothetical protein